MIFPQQILGQFEYKVSTCTNDKCVCSGDV